MGLARETRLTGLTLLTVHRDIPVDIPAAIDEFARRHPRRIQMLDITRVCHLKVGVVKFFRSLRAGFTNLTNKHPPQ